jgi:hypothetical protein
MGLQALSLEPPITQITPSITQIAGRAPFPSVSSFRAIGVIGGSKGEQPTRPPPGLPVSRIGARAASHEATSDSSEMTHHPLFQNWIQNPDGRCLQYFDHYVRSNISIIWKIVYPDGTIGGPDVDACRDVALPHLQLSNPKVEILLVQGFS